MHNADYTPVPYEFRELIQEMMTAKRSGKVFFFTGENKLDSAEGTITGFAEASGKGLFISLVPAANIRIDRIITLFGTPGPAMDEYSAYGNSCMECHGGYDLD
jgi:hypothetical protein